MRGGGNVYALQRGDLIGPGNLYMQRLLFAPEVMPRVGIIINIVRLYEVYDGVIEPFAYNVLWQNGSYELVWPDELEVVHHSFDEKADEK
jgi:hypothetical protein